jgi:hypothetical protein
LLTRVGRCTRYRGGESSAVGNNNTGDTVERFDGSNSRGYGRVYDSDMYGARTACMACLRRAEQRFTRCTEIIDDEYCLPGDVANDRAAGEHLVLTPFLNEDDADRATQLCNELLTKQLHPLDAAESGDTTVSSSRANRSAKCSANIGTAERWSTGMRKPLSSAAGL